MTARTIEKFTFDVRFDEPILALTPLEDEVEEIKPTFSQEDLDAARLAGYRQGAQEMQSQMREAIEAETLSVFQKLAAQLEPFLKTYEIQATTLGELTKELILESVDKLLPGYTPQHLLAQLEELIQTCLPSLLPTPEIKIQVHSSLVERVSEGMAQLPSLASYKGKIQVGGEEGEMKSCTLEWGQGKGILDLTHLRDQIQKTLGTGEELGETLKAQLLTSEEAPIQEEVPAQEAAPGEDLAFSSQIPHTQEEAQSQPPLGEESDPTPEETT